MGIDGRLEKARQVELVLREEGIIDPMQAVSNLVKPNGVVGDPLPNRIKQGFWSAVAMRFSILTRLQESLKEFII